MKFIRLCEAELETLKMMAANYPNSFVRKRAQGVIMNHNGIEAKQIASVFSVKIRAVYSWLNSYRDKGFIGLYTKKGQGRKSIFSALSPEEQQCILDKIDQGDSVKATTCFINENISQHISERMLKSYLKKRLCMEKNKVLAQTSSKPKRLPSESRTVEYLNAPGES